MRTKQLIKILERIDPEGESEVVIGNLPILAIEALPSYYDGRMQVVDWDIEYEDNHGYRAMNPTLYSFNKTHGKVKIHTTDLESLLLEYPEMEVENNGWIKDEQIEEWRRQGRAFVEYDKPGTYSPDQYDKAILEDLLKTT